jgi:hypothetical protein
MDSLEPPDEASVYHEIILFFIVFAPKRNEAYIRDVIIFVYTCDYIVQ